VHIVEEGKEGKRKEKGGKKEKERKKKELKRGEFRIHPGSNRKGRGHLKTEDGRTDGRTLIPHHSLLVESN
jgi:hypothetical protein